MTGAEIQKRCREKKLKKGLCIQCGKEDIFKAKRCKICYNKTIGATKLKRKERYQKGLCTNCGEFPYEENKKRCINCLKKQNEWYKNCNQSKEISDIINIREKNGLCSQCGERQPKKNRKRCSICLDKRKNWWISSGYREKQRLLDKERRSERRKKIIKNYGGKCVCCGEDEPIFLTIDHINEDGARRREELVGSKITRGKSHTATSTQFYRWLEKNHFPKDNFQLLCMNCNFGKHRNGGICPHQQGAIK